MRKFDVVKDENLKCEAGEDDRKRVRNMGV